MVRRERTLTLVAGSVALAMALAAPPVTARARWTPPPAAVLVDLTPSMAARVAEAVGQVQTGLAAPTSEAGAALTELGDLLLAAGLFNEAVRTYSAAIADAPDDPGLWLRVGRTEFAAGADESAVQAIQHSLALAPAQPIAEEVLGAALARMGRPEEAAARWRRALELAPNSPGALWSLGRVLAEQPGQEAEAIQLLKRLVELQPEADEIFYPLAQAYRRLGDAVTARDLLARSGTSPVEVDPEWNRHLARLREVSVVESLAVELDRGLSDSALFDRFAAAPGAPQPSVRRELELAAKGPGSPTRRARWHHALGALALLDGDEEAAREAFLAALRLDPTMIDPRLRLGNGAARAGQFDVADRYFREARELAPRDPEVLVRLAASLGVQGRSTEAREILNEVVDIDPGHVEGRMRLAAALDDAGDYAAAEVEVRRALELPLQRREAGEAHTRLARLLRRRGELDQSLEHSRSALEADPNSLPVLADAAVALASRGRMAEAAPLYQRWVELDPDDLRPRLPHAMALVLSGQHQQALDALNSATERFPADERLADLLTRHLAAAPDPSIRNGAVALERARRVMEQAPAAERAETLAMALAETGDFAGATALQERLLEGMTAAGAPAERLQQLRADLERYRSGRRCCGNGGG